MLAVNAMCNVIGWEDSVTRWIEGAGEMIDVIGIDHYPGTWVGFSYTDWTPVENLVRRINDPNDVWFGKQGAVMETGFSTWAITVADQARQEQWIRESLPALRDIIRTNNQQRANKVLFGNYYQLIDVDTSGILQENHFGILTSDFTRKQGFNTLQSYLGQF